MHLEAADVFQRAAQHVHAHERAEVADVSAGIHGEAARVHAHRVVANGDKVLQLPGQRVVETHRAYEGRGSVTDCAPMVIVSWPSAAAKTAWQCPAPAAA